MDPQTHGLREVVAVVVAGVAEASGARHGGGRCDVLEQLLSHTGASVLSVLQLGDPVVDRGVEFGQGLLLLQHGFVAKLGHARRAEVLADSRLQVAAPGAERCVGVAEILGSFIELAEFLCRFVNM